MFRYFWLEGTDLPDGIGFGLFSWKHILMDALCAAGIILLCFVFRTRSRMQQRLFLKVLALLLLAGNGLRDLVLVLDGRMGMSYLPLHLCSTAIFVYLLHAFLPETWEADPDGTEHLHQSGFREALGEIGYTLLMPGTICALLFPDWTRYPLMNFMSLHSFVWHALLIAYPMMLRISGRIHPVLSHLWYPVVYLCIITPPIMLFDKVTGCNYLFVSWPLKDTPQEWLYDLLGSYWRVGYAILVFAVILTIYLLIALNRRLSRFICHHLSPSHYSSRIRK